MKYAFFLALIAVNGLSVIAAPVKDLRMGPMQCDGDWLPKKNQGQEYFFDNAPEINALAQKYQRQLFDSIEGRQILLRSKKLGEQYRASIKIKTNGNIESQQMVQILRAQSGPNKILESDIDKLIETRWNKPNILPRALKNERIFEVEIIAGESHIRPLRLPH